MTTQPEGVLERDRRIRQDPDVEAAVKASAARRLERVKADTLVGQQLDQIARRKP